MSRDARRAAALAALLGAAGLAGPAALPAQSGEPVPIVTLDEARRRAAAANADAVAARGDVATAVWERRAAMAELFTPSLSADMGYTRFSDPFFNFGTGEITPNATSATLQARYVLLGAGRVGELRRARASLASAEAGETAARFRVALETDAAYYAVLADRELVRVAAERLRRAEEQFAVARVRVVAGKAISSDSRQLLLEVNRARLGVLRLDSALTTSRLRLGRSVGLPGRIVHGLCTMAFTGRAVLEAAGVDDPREIRRLAVRFSAPLFPGDVLTTRVWKLEEKVYGFVAAGSDGTPVIKDGRAELR